MEGGEEDMSNVEVGGCMELARKKAKGFAGGGEGYAEDGEEDVEKKGGADGGGELQLRSRGKRPKREPG